MDQEQSWVTNSPSRQGASMTDAELIYLLRMHISDIKWRREPDLSEGTVKVLGEAVDALAAKNAKPPAVSALRRNYEENRNNEQVPWNRN